MTYRQLKARRAFIIIFQRCSVENQKVAIAVDSLWRKHPSGSQQKLPSREGSWMGEYSTCGSCHLVHAAQSALAPRLLQHYDQ